MNRLRYLLLPLFFITMLLLFNRASAQQAPVMIDFESPDLGSDTDRVIDPYVDSTSQVSFAVNQATGNEVVGLVRNDSTSACVEPANDDQKLGLATSSNDSVGVATFPIRATFPQDKQYRNLTLSVEFQTSNGTPVRVRLFNTADELVAFSTKIAGPPGGTCGFPGDDRARTTVTVNLSQTANDLPVAYAVMDLDTATGDTVFVIDDFSFQVLPSKTDGLYGTEILDDSLWIINKTNSRGQSIGSVEDIMALSCSADEGILYGIQAIGRSDSSLSTVNTFSGVSSSIGDTGFQSVTGLAYDSQNDVLYGVTFLDELLTINPNTGAGTLVGQPGTSSLDSLAYHDRRNQLFAVNIDTNTLYQIDPQTGAGQAVGSIGFDNVSGLTYDADTGNLYGAARASGELITIDPDTGSGTAVGSLSNTAFNGLAGCASATYRVYVPLIIKSDPSSILTPIPTVIPTLIPTLPIVPLAPAGPELQ